MAQTTIKKNANGYGYKYTDIAEINNSLEEMGITYYQYIERVGEDDYIYTVPIINGEEKNPRRGCKVVKVTFDKKSNPAQELGAALTYARRYSLLMAFGLATSDDDAECITRELPKVEGEIVKETPKKKAKETVPGYPSREEMMKVVVKHYPEGSANRQALLETARQAKPEVETLDDLTDAQVIAVYNKFGGR